MKKIYSFMMLLFVAFQANSQTLLLEEHFNYPADSLIRNHGWYPHSAASINPIQVSNGGLSWVTTPYLGSGVGNAASVSNTGADENKPFTSFVDSGDVYVAFMMRVNNEVTATNTGYFFHLGQYTNTTTPVFTSISSAFRARTYIVPGTTAAQYKLGLTFNSATAPSTGGDVSGDLDTAVTYLVVLKYSFIPGIDNDSVSLFVFADGANIATEPATPTIGPVAGTASDLAAVQLVALRQYNSGQNITVDGIVAKDGWDFLVASPTLSAPNLITPPNNTILPISGSGSQTATIRWTSANAGTQPVTYEWLAIAPGGSFNTPVVALPAAGDTTLVLSYAAVDALLASLNFNIGDSIYLDWTVRATAGTASQLANQTWRITLFRGGLGTPNDSLSAFALLSPPNNTMLTVQGDPTQLATISWESASPSLNAATTNYTWLLDVPAGDFSAPVLVVNAGTDTSISLPFGAIADSLTAKGVAVGATFTGKWTVRATADTLARLATTPFDISITRGVMSSVHESTFSLGTQLYPNPATDLVNIMLPGTENSLVVVRLLNATGQQVQQFQLDNLQSDRISIDLASHPNGIYLLSVQADDKIAIKRLVIQR